MDKKINKNALLVMSFAFIVTLIFPPFEEHYKGQVFHQGFHFVFNQNEDGGVNLGFLMAEWFVIAFCGFTWIKIKGG